MKKLAEYTNQTHITSVIRAAIIKNEVPDQILIVGGEHEHRNQLVYSIKKALCCNNPIKGDFCGVCGSCTHAEVPHRGVRVWDNYSASTLGGFTTHLYSLATMPKTFLGNYMSFELNPDKTAGPGYDPAVDLVIHLAKSDDKTIYLKTREFVIKHGGYSKLQDYLLEVGNDILSIKHGAYVGQPSEKVSLLAQAIPTFRIVQFVRALWDTTRSVSAVADQDRATILTSVILANVLNPKDYEAQNEELPISLVEIPAEPPLTVEELEALI